MTKRTEKGNWGTINAGGTSKLNNYKHEFLSDVSKDVPVREWKPYREPAALRRNIERCKELTALPSRFA